MIIQPEMESQVSMRDVIVLYPEKARGELRINAIQIGRSNRPLEDVFVDGLRERHIKHLRKRLLV